MKINSACFAGALLFLFSAAHAGEPSQAPGSSPNCGVGQAFQPAGSGDFPVASSGARGWKPPCTGMLENLPCEPDNPHENRSPTSLFVQSLTLDLPARPRPADTNSIAAVSVDQEIVPMLQDPPVSRLGPKNIWRLLYEEGDLESIHDPMSRAGADVYHGDL